MANENAQVTLSLASLSSVIRMMVADELRRIKTDQSPSVMFASPLIGGSSGAPSGITVGHVGADFVGEAGLRDSDSFRWRHTGNGAVTIKNVAVAYNGVVAEYADGSVSITSGTKYVCAKVVWETDESSGEVTGVASVTISAEDTLADAAKVEEDGSGVRIPLYKMKKLSTTGVDSVVCVTDYIHGTGQAVSLSDDDWTTDSNSATLNQYSIEIKPKVGDQPRYLQLRDFDDPIAFEVRYPGHASWSADKDKQKVCVRYEQADGVISLRFASHNPMPTGTVTNAAVMWNTTLVGWEAVPPTQANDDTTYLTQTVTTDDRVVVGLQKGSTGLVQAVTKKLGAMGGVPTGYTERASSIVDMQVSDTDPETIQVKRGTLLVKDVDAAWSTFLSPTAYTD